MKFTLFGALTLAFALGATTAFAAPLASSEANDVQLRSEKAVTQIFSRSPENFDVVERSSDDLFDTLLEYSSRSIGDSGSTEDLVVRGHFTHKELYGRSPDEEDLVISARSLGPVGFSLLARSDEDDALFAREEELVYRQTMDKTIVMRNAKLNAHARAAFHKMGEIIKKVVPFGSKLVSKIIP